jgi:hypothetical protein
VLDKRDILAESLPVKLSLFLGGSYYCIYWRGNKAFWGPSNGDWVLPLVVLASSMSEVSDPPLRRLTLDFLDLNATSVNK